MAEPASWSLTARLRRLFLASTLLFVVAISIASGVYLWSSVSAQVDGLANEECEEVTAAFKRAEFSIEHFQEEIEEEQRRHPESPMAWRVWLPDGSPPLEFGVHALLDADWPRRAPLEETVARAGGFRSRTLETRDGTRIGLVLDGRSHYRRLGWYAVTVLVLVAASFLITLAIARQVFARVSETLHDVAERTRAARSGVPNTVLEVEGAPEEIREISDALAETLQKIREESQEVRVFTAGIAHELRSPVQNLIGETEVALIARRDADVYRAVLASHLDELRGLGDAVDNLVTICSRNETRRTAPRETFDLETEARLRLQRERNLAERTGIAFEFSTQGDLRVVGDREGILRAVRNLVQNAIQWSPPGARVVVRIEAQGDEILVTVEDQGPGVPEELRARIFEPFFRGPSAQGRRIGYGLGLALVKGTALEHGGDVVVDASPLGGARFRLTLARRATTRSGVA